MKRITKLLFFVLLVKPLVLIILGLNLRGRANLPRQGPVVVAANHNSHLDAVVLMSLFPLSRLHKVRPVAAADYFYKNRFLKWIATYCIDIVPLDRKNTGDRSKLFKSCDEALDNHDILILFPEGSRGQPEHIGDIKKGLYHLIKNRDEVKVIPVVMHGLGKSLPKGDFVLVPFNCDVVIGEPLSSARNSDDMVQQLKKEYDFLLSHCLTRIQ